MKIHQLNQKLDALQSRLQNLQPHLKQLLSKERAIRQREMAPADYARWNLAIAYSLESLIYGKYFELSFSLSKFILTLIFDCIFLKIMLTHCLI